MSKLYFFRHAQASYLADNYDKLSDHGEKQSAELGKYLVQKNIQFDRIFVGPLARQKKTFEIVADQFSKNKKPIPEAVLIPELREHEGPEAMKLAIPKLMDVPQIQKLFEAIKENPALRKRNNLLAFQYFMEEWAENNITITGAEPWQVFRRNVKIGLENILEKTGQGETVGAFTSGGTISAITAESLNINQERQIATMNFSVRNTSFSVFLYSKKQFNLLSFNELPHLSEEMITFV